MEFLHIQSANITIFLACVFLVISFCWLRSRNEGTKSVIKKMGGSFFAGILMGLGYALCGLPRRRLVFASLTPGSNWSSSLLIFLVVAITLNFLTYQILLK